MNSTSSDIIDSILESIIEAERAGADTTELVERFNKILFNDDCLECKEALIEIEDEARYLKSRYIEESNFNITIAYIIYAPSASLIASLSGLYLYERWKRYKARRYKDE